MGNNVLHDDDEAEMAESVLEVLGEVAFGIMDEAIQECPEVIQHYVRLTQDRIEALEKEATALRWQDIESAKRDGQTVLISMSSTGPVWSAYWRKERETGMANWSEENVVGWCRVGFCDLGLYPTHWMPMPKPQGKTNE